MNLFVWDFHGVLEKGNENAVIEVTNQILEESGKDARLTEEQCKQFYGKKWHEYFKQLCPELTTEEIRKMIQRGVEITNQTDVIFRHIKPSDHVDQVLKTIKEKNHENLVISNTEINALKKYIRSVKITEFIDHTIGADGHKRMFEKDSKTILIKEFLKGKNYDKIISIGDRKTDVDLGKEIGATTYLYSRDKSFEEGKEADFCISNLKEVLKEI